MLHDRSCNKTVGGRSLRDASLKSQAKQTSGTLDLISLQERYGLHRADGKQLAGVTIIP